MTLSLLAPAKINLHLWITAIRDDGYHELDTSFAYVDLYDRLTITPADQLVVRCSDAALDGPNNLVFRLLEAVRQKFHITDGLDIYIEKHIPQQGGLGGGSSDAATALLAASKLWNLPWSRQQMIDFAVRFGADIPCFLFGQPSLASGVGETLQPLPTVLPTGTLLLAHPGVGLSTRLVFDFFDQQVGLTGLPAAATMRARFSGAWLGVNDLEAPARALCPPLVQLMDAMQTATAGLYPCWMSGSGTTVVALLPDDGKAQQIAAFLEKQKLASWTFTGRLLALHPEIGA